MARCPAGRPPITATSPRRGLAAVIALAMALASLAVPTGPAHAAASAEPDEMWVTNGDVHAVVEAGERIHLGGNFDQVGPNTGFGVPVDPASGVRWPTFPKVNGTVYVAVPDGAGGWYIGGDFTRVGERSRQNAARVLADGNVGGWNPNTDFAVRAIAVSRTPGANVAYIGGDFTVLRSTSTSTGVPAFGLAATSMYTGAPVWGLPGTTLGSVTSLALSPDGTNLYVGGRFTTLGGVTRSRLASVDTATGSLDVSWAPEPDGDVSALAVAVDGRVYTGGAFTRIAGTARQGLAVLTPSGDADAVWEASANGPVHAIAMSVDGSMLYAGGDFSEVGGRARNRLAALATAGSGAVEAWDPGSTVEIRALALDRDGTRLYAGGGDDTGAPGFAGVPRRALYALDTATGAVDGTFDPRPGAAVLALAVSGPAVYAGGQFTSINGVTRANLAALDRATGALDASFRADTDGVVNAVVVDGGDVYAGGSFNKVNGVTRRRLVRVDAAGKVAATWQANASAEVKSLALSGSRLFVGGVFSTVGGASRGRLASVRTLDGTVDGWDPDLDAAPQDMRLSADHSRLYVAGDFSTVGSTPRQKLAAVDVSTGLATSWNPKPRVPLTSLALSTDGSLVFVATRGSRSAGNRIQAWHALSGSLVWERLGDGDFQAVDVSGSLVYAGGHFTTVSGQVRGHLAAFDQRDGTLQPWAPSISGVHGVLDIHVTADAVLVAGQFTKVSGVVAQGVVRFANAGDPPVIATTTTTTTAPSTTTTTAPSTGATAPQSTTTTTTAPESTTSTTRPTPGSTTTTTASPPAVGAAVRSGYWMVGTDGVVYAFGDARHLGDAHLDASAEAVDVEAMPSGAGYWVVDSRGKVSAFGHARPLGDADPARLAPGETITSLSATPTGRGYWLFTTRGRVLPFGDAEFHGDMSTTRLNAPVLDSIPTVSGRGYYMVAGDGGIFAFGDARFHGSMGGVPLNAPVQSLVPDGDGSGYWLVASDGGIFAFDAAFRGSMGGVPLNRPVTGMVRYGDGYLMVGEDGGIFNFSSSPFAGSLGDRPPARPIVAVASLTD